MKIVEIVIWGMRKLKKSHHYIPCVSWRWARVKQAKDKTLVNVINEEEELTFHTLRGNSPHGLFNQHNQEIALSLRDTLVLLAMAMALMVPSTLLPSKIESSKGMALYSPPRVMR